MSSTRPRRRPSSRGWRSSWSPRAPPACTGTACCSTAPSSSTPWPATQPCGRSRRGACRWSPWAAAPRRRTRVYWADNDPAAATRLSLDHLAARGAADVAAVTWMTTDHWTQECLRAYHAWCRERGRRPRLQVVARDDDEALRAAAERLLTTGRRPDAVWSLAELPALWVLRVAAERGVRVPEDVMVAGTADFGLGATSVPPLTLHRLPRRRAGSRGGTAPHRPGARPRRRRWRAWSSPPRSSSASPRARLAPAPETAAPHPAARGAPRLPATRCPGTPRPRTRPRRGRA